MNFLNYRKKDTTAANKLTGALFIIYLGALFWIIVLKLNISFAYNGKAGNVNLIPFHEPVLLNGKVGYGEMILNVLIFIPLGLYAGILFKKLSTGKKILSFFTVSLLCEVLQFALKIGAFDITDLITNTFGGIIGWVLFKATEKGFKNTAKAQKFINIIATLGTVLLLSLLLYLKINKRPVFRR
ncbi:MAG: VanZ family protein [Spirosomataceae bacterium]